MLNDRISLIRKYRPNREVIIFSLISFLIVIVHSFISRFHYHECDSSIVFDFLHKDSIDSFFSFKRHLEVTSAGIFYPLRFFFGIFSEYIPIQPIRTAIKLSLTTTYPLLEGLIYGLYQPRSFEYFYRYASLINILFLTFSLILLYKANKSIGKSSILAFLFSFGLLCLYSVNAYSYHLGSTVWFISSSCLSIYSIVCLRGLRKDLLLSLALISSYPTLLFWILNFIKELRFIENLKIAKRINIDLHKAISLSLKDNLKKYRYSSITFLVIIIMFYPYGESYRTPFDWRGFFTPFSIFPLNQSIDLITYVISFTVFFIFLFSVFIALIKPTILNLTYSNHNNIRSSIFLILSYLIILFVFISLKKLTFSTSRHTLFMLPYIMFIANYGAQNIYMISIRKIRSINMFLNFILLISLTSAFIGSIYSSSYRLDPLKMNSLPKEIREFQVNSTSNSFISSSVACGIHFKYTDFSKPLSTYNKIEPYIDVPLSFEGKRLFVTQRPSDAILNYDDNLKKGDLLLTNDLNQKIILMEDPFVIAKKIYFDSMNYNPNNSNNENYGFARPNSVYVFPVEVINIKKNNISY